MIKFEEHEGKLFRMLEEPEPLTSEATLPCVVRLIQDDSPMGRYNRDAAFFDVTGKLFIAQKIKENPLYRNTLHAYEKRSISHDYCIASIHTLEVIGYPVAEGSHWWALYQMMQGEGDKVTKRHLSHTYWQYDASPHLKCISEYNCGTLQIMVSPEIWLTTAEPTGWQIYKEPEQPKYKVGDWVEFIDVGGRKSQGKYLSNTDGNAIIVLDTTCNMRVVVHTTKIIRKLSPSEVEVDFGFAKGRILSRTSGDVKVLNNKSIVIATIIVSEITNPATSELVESLLKAQVEEK